MATMGNLNRPTTGMMGNAPALPSNRKPQAPVSAAVPLDMAPTDPVSRPANGVTAAPPLPPGDPATPVRTMQTGGPLPPTPVTTRKPMPTLPPGDPAMRPAGNSGIVPPGNANGLYRNSQQMREAPPMPSMPNTPTPDSGRAPTDGNTTGVAQPVSLPPGMTYQQRPVSATGMPSQPPGPVGRPAGGLFSMLRKG